MKPAIVLLSGGLDSATVAAIAADRGFEIVALSFRYGQRHAIELQAAAAVAASMGIREHIVADIDLRALGGSALTDDIEVPKDRGDIAEPHIPVTYVPARNTVFLSYALALAEVRKANDLFIGVNALDYSGYPDCRPAFIHKFQELARLATRAGVEGAPLTIHAPLIEWSKAQIIQEGTNLGVDYSLTTSCYDPDAAGAACGRCDSCVLRRRGFKEAGFSDPTRYQFSAV